MDLIGLVREVIQGWFGTQSNSWKVPPPASDPPLLAASSPGLSNVMSHDHTFVRPRRHKVSSGFVVYLTHYIVDAACSWSHEPMRSAAKTRARIEHGVGSLSQSLQTCAKRINHKI